MNDNFENIPCPPLYLAPMAGAADRAFRIICRDNGADILTSEMISAKAIYYKDKKTIALTSFSDAERPFKIQLFGSEPEILAYAAHEITEKICPDGIDINMGCPAPKITDNGEGSALMKDINLIFRIVSAVRAATDLPLSVKLRAGWDDKTKNAVDAARAAEAAGADMICVHGKTRAQSYKPPVDLDIIREVKHAISVPVIGNGEICDYLSARRMLEETRCDALMIGRAALGAPWLFNEIKCGFSGEKFVKPDIFDTMMRHIKLKMSFMLDKVAVCELRGQLSYYIKGKKHSAQCREKLNSAEKCEDIIEILTQWNALDGGGTDD